MAFDCTYLTASLAQMSLHDKVGLVGGAYWPTNPEQAFLDLESEERDTKNIVRGKNMLEMLVWDPCGVAKCPMSVCSLPLDLAVGGPNAGERAGWAMMEIIGSCLKAGSKVIKGISFDAAPSHQLIRRVMHGQVDDIDPEKLAEVPWFGELTHTSLPKNTLPRLPIRICYDKDEVVYGQPGPCTLAIVS